MSLDRKDYKTSIPQLEKRLSAVEKNSVEGLKGFDILKEALDAERLARQKAVLKVDEGIDLVTVKMFYALVDPNDYVGGLPPDTTSWSETMPEMDATSVIVSGSSPERKRVLWYKSKTLRNGNVVNESAPQQIQLMDGVFSFVNSVSSDSGWTTIDGSTITTGIIQANQGDSFFNLNDGTFKVYSSVTQQGIIWNGSNLTINGSITLTGHSDTVADEISALQVSADGSLLYDHTYAWNNAKTEVTFTAHVYRGGEDVTSEFSDEDFTWYYKTEANLEEQPLTNTNNTPTNCGKTITIPTTGASPKILLSAIGYGAEIVGKFTPPSNNRNLLRSNGDTYTDVNNRALQTRAGSGTEVRVRDLEYTTTLTTSNALMVVTSETEKLATIETLADTLKSSTTPIVDGTATVGNEKKFASGNHVHPTDTSRASAVHTHTTSDITDFPTIPTDTSDLTNGAGFISTETDPTVPSWAKQVSKPSYTFSEIGSTPTTISGYGITDASISSGTITLGYNSITPLTSETDPVFTASDAYGITSSDISNWNGKADDDDFVGTDGNTAGTHGLVPAPLTTDAGKYLKADGTWATPSGGGGVTLPIGSVYESINNTDPSSDLGNTWTYIGTADVGGISLVTSDGDKIITSDGEEIESVRVTYKFARTA